VTAVAANCCVEGCEVLVADPDCSVDGGGAVGCGRGEVAADCAVDCVGVGVACASGGGGTGLGSGIGREARAGAKTARRARSAAEIRVSRGLSDCMDSL